VHPSGPPRTHRRMVEGVQKIARAPFTALARGEARVVIDGRCGGRSLSAVADNDFSGVEVLVSVERQERPRGGWQVYWHCPRCDRRC